MAELFGVSTFNQSEYVDSYEFFGAEFLKLRFNL